MRPYLSVLSARIRMLLQYRAAALAGMSTQLFWGLIRVMIFEAFYRTATQAQPMTYAEVVNYVWLGQALFALLPWQPDNDVRTMVRTGTVAYELVRPVDLYTFWYSRSLANRIAPALLRSVPLFCLAFLFFGLQAPASPGAAAAWALATVGAILLGGALSNLVNISLMWTIAGEGLHANAVDMHLRLFGYGDPPAAVSRRDSNPYSTSCLSAAWPTPLSASTWGTFPRRKSGRWWGISSRGR